MMSKKWKLACTSLLTSSLLFSCGLGKKKKHRSAAPPPTPTVAPPQTPTTNPLSLSSDFPTSIDSSKFFGSEPALMVKDTPVRWNVTITNETSGLNVGSGTLVPTGELRNIVKNVTFQKQNIYKISLTGYAHSQSGSNQLIATNDKKRLDAENTYLEGQWNKCPEKTMEIRPENLQVSSAGDKLLADFKLCDLTTAKSFPVNEKPAFNYQEEERDVVFTCRSSMRFTVDLAANDTLQCDTRYFSSLKFPVKTSDAFISDQHLKERLSYPKNLAAKNFAFNISSDLLRYQKSELKTYQYSLS